MWATPHALYNAVNHPHDWGWCLCVFIPPNCLVILLMIYSWVYRLPHGPLVSFHQFSANQFRAARVVWMFPSRNRRRVAYIDLDIERLCTTIAQWSPYDMVWSTYGFNGISVAKSMGE